MQVNNKENIVKNHKCGIIRLYSSLQVFSMDDGSALFTLHGHCGPITSVFVDGSLGVLGSDGDVTVDLGVGAIIGSGSQDGMLCVWEVVTGACVYR